MHERGGVLQLDKYRLPPPTFNLHFDINIPSIKKTKQVKHKRPLFIDVVYKKALAQIASY